MKYLMSAEWWQAAGIRAVKTMFQTGAALLVTQMPGGAVDWVSVGSAALLAGIASHHRKSSLHKAPPLPLFAPCYALCLCWVRIFAQSVYFVCGTLYNKK